MIFFMYFSNINLNVQDSIVIVRACEGALILASLPSVSNSCNAVRGSLNAFSLTIANRLALLCQQIPDDMDTGDIEDCSVAWGLVPRDQNQPHFIGRGQLNEFLCWLDYANCLSVECPQMADDLCYHVRKSLLECVVEPSMLDQQTAAFMLVLTAKLVRQLESRPFSKGKMVTMVLLALNLYFIFSKTARNSELDDR